MRQMGSSWSRDDVLACLAVLALLAVPGCGVVMWLGAGAGLWTAIVVGCSAVVAAVAGYLAHHARLDFVAGGHQYRVATMQNALDQALARVEVLQKKLRDQESELRHEQGFVKDLIDSCEARRLRIAELERELVAAKAESATDTVRELRRARRDLPRSPHCHGVSLPWHGVEETGQDFDVVELARGAGRLRARVDPERTPAALREHGEPRRT